MVEPVPDSRGFPIDSNFLNKELILAYLFLTHFSKLLNESSLEKFSLFNCISSFILKLLNASLVLIFSWKDQDKKSLFIRKSS